GKKAAVPAAPLAYVGLHALIESDLQRWRQGLPEAMKAATKQRLVNDLKAALNEACAAYRDRLPGALPAVVKHGLRAEARADDEDVARENQILADHEVSALLRAAMEIDAEQN